LEEDGNNTSKSKLLEEESKVEPELPSDSYFIMIFPEQAKYFTSEASNFSEIDSSKEISSSESSVWNRKNSVPSDTARNMFYIKGENKKSNKNKHKPSSAELFHKNPEIKFPLIMSGSIANDWIEEAKSEDEEETEKVQTELWSNGRIESAYEDYDLEYSIQESNPNITNSKEDDLNL